MIRKILNRPVTGLTAISCFFGLATIPILLQAIVSLLGFLAMTLISAQPSLPRGDQATSGLIQVWSVVKILISLGLCIWLLISAIGTVTRKKWARRQFSLCLKTLSLILFGLLGLIMGSVPFNLVGTGVGLFIEMIVIGFFGTIFWINYKTVCFLDSPAVIAQCNG